MSSAATRNLAVGRFQATLSGKRVGSGSHLNESAQSGRYASATRAEGSYSQVKLYAAPNREPQTICTLSDIALMNLGSAVIRMNETSLPDGVSLMARRA